MPTTATRKPAKSNATLPNSQTLHDTLSTANDSAALARFARNTGCSTAEVASADGRLGILQVFDAMRRRGYQVSEPKRPQAQPRQGFTAWLVTVTLPQGVKFYLAYHTPGGIK